MTATAGTPGTARGDARGVDARVDESVCAHCGDSLDTGPNADRVAAGSHRIEFEFTAVGDDTIHVREAATFLGLRR